MVDDTTKDHLPWPAPVPALESWKPPNTNVRPPVYRPRGTGLFPPAKLPPSGRGQVHVTS